MWPDFLLYILQEYHASIHQSTQCTPNYLFFGIESRIPIDLIDAVASLEEAVPECHSEYAACICNVSQTAFAKAREYLKTSVQRNKSIYDNNSFVRYFHVGDWAWINLENYKTNWEKFGMDDLVIQKLGKVNYAVQRRKIAEK